MYKYLKHLITRLLSRFLDSRILNEVLGDLTEDYNQNLRQYGEKRAHIRFIIGGLGYVRYWQLFKLKKSEKTQYTMDIWKNYFTSATRNLIRNKRYTFISLFGLVVGFSSSLAIFQYVHYESNYDNFYEGQQIHRLTHTFTNNSGVSQSASTFMAVRDAILDAIPAIDKATHFNATGGIIKVDQEVFSTETIIAAGQDFFQVFELKIISGDPKLLIQPNTIFLSQSTALKFFNQIDVSGEVVEMQGIFGQTWNAQVAGVYQDIPDNSHLNIDVVFSETKLINAFRDGNLFGNIPHEDIPWRLLGFPTYVVLKPGTNHEQFEQQVNKLIADGREIINRELDQKHEIWLQDIADIHTTKGIQSELTPTNDAEVIFLFTIIGLLILAIAWINYINLSTARSISRSKEVGIRKVLGSTRIQLSHQFLLEVFLLNFLAMSCSVLLLNFATPFLEHIIGIKFISNMDITPKIFLSILGMLITGTFFAGIYPAFIMSNYDCMEVLKGKLKYAPKGIVLRRILVISQFVFSIFLISALMIVHAQMNYILSHSLGVDIDHTYLLDAPPIITNNDIYLSKMNALVNEMEQVPGIDAVSVASMVPGIPNIWRNSTENRSGQGAGLFIHRSIVDERYFDLYNIQLVSGRTFSESRGNEQNSLVVNETTRKRLGYNSADDILNEKLYFAGQEFNVIGVVKDFYQRGAQFPYEPLSFSPDTALAGGYISVKINSRDIEEVLLQVENTFELLFPGSPYNGRFIDDVFESQLAAEFRFRNLFSIFSMLALSIAILGLIGLSAFIINQKTKEISIRKVLGASGSGLFILLNKEYLIICSIAFVIAGPIVYLLSPLWLDNFTNRIQVHPGFYIIPWMIILTIVVLTTINHTIKAIRLNPANTLKEE